MKSADYPLFIAPEHLENRVAREWSHAEADEYFAWLMQVKDNRIQIMLDFLHVKATGTPDEILGRIGEKMVSALKDPAFSEYRNLGKDITGEEKWGTDLSPTGYALAADVGLLFARLMQQECGEKVHWEVVKKPKNIVDYHLPVLAGFGKTWLEPIHVSINSAKKVLLFDVGPDEWKRVFAVWLSFCTG